MATEEDLKKFNEQLRQTEKRFDGLTERLKSVQDAFAISGTDDFVNKLKEVGLSVAEIEDIQRNYTRAVRASTDALNTRYLEIENEIEVLNNASEATRKLIAELEYQNRVLQQSTEATTEQKQAIRALIKGKKDFLAQLEEEQDQLKASSEVFEGLANSLGLTGKITNTVTGKIGKSAEGFKAAADKAGGFDKVLGKGIKSAGFMVSAGEALIQISAMLAAKFIDVAMEVRAATFEIRQASGGVKDQTTALIGARQELLSYGMSTAEAAKALTDLNNQVFGFIRLSDEAQAASAAFVGQLELIGVSASDSTNIINSFRGANADLEQGLSDAQRTMMRVGMASQDMTGGMGQGIRELNAALPNLRKFGTEAEDVFLGMKAVAEETGIAMDTLLGMAQKMDTFTGAADMAGQLNALMGMQLSTTELLLATDEERLRMIKQQFDATGRSFEQMGRFEKIALSQAAGFQSVDEAAKFFNASLGDIAANELKMKLQAKRQQEFTDAVRAAVDPLKALSTNLLRLFVVFEPLIHFVNDFVAGLNVLIEGGHKFLSVITAITTVVTGSAGIMLVLKGLGVTVAVLSAKFIAIAAVIVGVVALFYQLAKAIANIGKTANQRRSPSFIDIFMMLPDLLSAAVEQLGKMVSFFGTLAAKIRDVGIAVKQYLPSWMGGGESDINVNATTTNAGIINAQAANRAVAGAATNRNMTTNTSNTVNNTTVAPSGPQSANINMTIDLGKNRVFREAVRDVLYEEDK